MDCAPSEDSDQPGHPPSLIIVFAVHMKKHWILSYPLSAQRKTLIWTPVYLMSRLLTLIKMSFFSVLYFHRGGRRSEHNIIPAEWKGFYGQRCYYASRRSYDSHLINPKTTMIHLSWIFEPRHDKTNENGCAPSEDSDQPGHPPSLIRVFAVRMKKHWVLSYPLSAQRRLWSYWADAQADLSLRWAHTHFVGFVMSRLISRL